MPINNGPMAASQMPWTSMPINMNNQMVATQMPLMSLMKSSNAGQSDSSVPKHADNLMSWNNNNNKNSPMQWMTESSANQESGATAQMPAQVMAQLPWNFELKSSNEPAAPSQMAWDNKMKNNNNKNGKIETPRMVWNRQPMETMRTKQMGWNHKSSNMLAAQMPSDHSTTNSNNSKNNNNTTTNNNNTEMNVSPMSANNKTTSDNSNNSDVDGNSFPGVTMLMRIPSYFGVQPPQQKQQKKKQMQQQKANITNATSNNKQTQNVARWQSQTSTQQPQEQQTAPWQSQFNNNYNNNNNNDDENDSAWTNSLSSEMNQTEDPMNINAWTSSGVAPMIQGTWDADGDQITDNNKQPVEEELRVSRILVAIHSIKAFAFYGSTICPFQNMKISCLSRDI